MKVAYLIGLQIFADLFFLKFTWAKGIQKLVFFDEFRDDEIDGIYLL
jgi:hypothetical protein